MKRYVAAMVLSLLGIEAWDARGVPLGRVGADNPSDPI